MENVDQARLDELRLRKRGRHPEHRLIGEEHRSFRHGIDVTGEAQRSEPIQEVVGETALLAQPVDVFRREVQRLEIVEGLLETCGEEEVSARRKPAHENSKTAVPVCPWPR